MNLKAQATLAVLLATAIVLVSVSVLIGSISYVNYTNERDSIKATQAFLLADSALENGLLKLQRNAAYAGETFATSEGTATITVTTTSSTRRQVAVVATSSNIRRELSVEVSVTGQVNPFQNLAVFAGDDVHMIKASARLTGNLWTNDNVNLDESTVVRGNIFAAGQGSVSNSSVRNSARLEDNVGTPEVEGNISAIDRIKINNSGYVQNTAKSANSVQISSGGYAGQVIVDGSLKINTIEVPVFDFNTYKAQAQAAGTYYATPAQFLNYLSLNGNTIAGGVHYIGSNSTLTLPATGNVSVTGTIISEGPITIYSNSYIHQAQDNLPAIAAKGTIQFVDSTPIASTATVTGIIYSEKSINLKHDQYTGSQTYAVQVTGALWGGDQVTIEDHSELVFDAELASQVQGFNFDATELPPSTDNIVNVINWSIQ